jgi:drug/metabolite transporter (DMT)-like permease
VLLAAGVGLFLLPAVLAWNVHAAAWPYVAASVVLHLGYFAGLAAAYARADLSVVYPVARGSGPVFVLLIGTLALGMATSPLQTLGVALVAGGILLVRGMGDHLTAGDLALALAVGACIGGYTLVDSHGVQHASPLPYLVLVNGGVVLLYMPLVLRLRGAAAVRREVAPRAFAGGAAALGAYTLVLAALKIAPAAAVAAVRESSVVMAALLARLMLKEPVGPSRLSGAVAVAGGVALIAVS